MPPEGVPQSARAWLVGRTVAVTGASGYIGSALVAQLVALGAGVVRGTRDLARLPAAPAPHAGARVRDVQGSLRDRATWAELLRDADALVHLACETSAVAAEGDPEASRRDSVEPIETLAGERSLAPTLRTVVLAGSATQYGLGHSLPVHESDPDRPAGVYERHKCEAERAARPLREGGVAVVSARLANVYGPGNATSSPDRGVLTKMVGAAMAGKPLSVYAPGDWLRDYVFIADVVNALCTLAALGSQVPEGRALVCSGRSVPLLEAAQGAAAAAERRTGQRVPVSLAAAPRPLLPVETRQFAATPARLAALGWRPLVPLAEGLAQTAAALPLPAPQPPAARTP